MGAAEGIAERAFLDAQRQPEVRQDGAVLSVEHNVRGLDVTVNHAPAVRVIERAADAPDHVEHVLVGQPSTAICVLFQYLAQVFAFDKDHRHIVMAFVFAELEHAHDIRVMQTRDGARFAPEPFGVFSLIRSVEIAVDDLDRRVALQTVIVTLTDARHPATSEQALDNVIA